MGGRKEERKERDQLKDFHFPEERKKKKVFFSLFLDLLFSLSRQVNEGEAVGIKKKSLCFFFRGAKKKGLELSFLLSPHFMQHWNSHTHARRTVPKKSKIYTHRFFPELLFFPSYCYETIVASPSSLSLPLLLGGETNQPTFMGIYPPLGGESWLDG